MTLRRWLAGLAAVAPLVFVACGSTGRIEPLGDGGATDGGRPPRRRGRRVGVALALGAPVVDGILDEPARREQRLPLRRRASARAQRASDVLLQQPASAVERHGGDAQPFLARLQFPVPRGKGRRIVVGSRAALLPLRGLAGSFFPSTARLLNQSRFAAQLAVLIDDDDGTDLRDPGGVAATGRSAPA